MKMLKIITLIGVANSSILLAVVLTPITAAAEPTLTCLADSTFSPLILIPIPNNKPRQTMEYMRGAIVYKNDSTDWYSCTVNCAFNGTGPSFSLALNCTGVVPPSQPSIPGLLTAKFLGSETLCVSTIHDPEHGITEAGATPTRTSCSKIPDPTR